MIIPDINLLVYAHNDGAPQHDSARFWWEGLVNLGSAGDGQWVTMLIFGAIAVALSLVDGAYYFALTRGRMRAGGQRIQRHLTNMLAGTTATVTAVMVVNIDLNPVWLPWILPTIVITPLIVWWNVRVRGPARRRG